MVRIVDEWSAANPSVDVFGQLPLEGPDDYVPTNFEFVQHLRPEEYTERYRNADFIVAHAGMGSIITALSLAKPIIIFPRRAALREQRNDHQIATVKRFARVTGIVPTFEDADLPAAMDELLAGMALASAPMIGSHASKALIDGLSHTIASSERRGVLNPFARLRRPQDAEGVGAETPLPSQ